MRAAADSLPSPALLADGRYRIESRIGRGGMASVYRAIDTATGETLALKQLSLARIGAHAQRAAELFELEYHTLVQLAHPCIVAAHDYGVADGLPYYTMELLDGGDLQDRAPMDWRTVCRVGRDACSALSLVHSRRLVYRDLSPRNLRCTRDGGAKLIDFGAIAEMGAAKHAVCTPAVAAPEVARLQPLDGRADLYALGATLYHALTGRHAYPARTFGQLTALWSTSIQPPSHFVPDIPEALDRLVMDLLQVDAHLRPSNAAEVSHRLSAIGDLGPDETLLSSQAYLTTPSLVGRDDARQFVRRRFQRLRERGRGTAMLVRGPTGVGRSRFLDACVLEGKLEGATVLKVTAGEVGSEPFSAIDALAQQWLIAAEGPAMAHARADWALLANMLPCLGAHEGADFVPAVDAAALRDAGVPAVRRWFLAASRERTLAIVVDDVDRFDLESQAFIALLANDAASERLAVLTSRSGTIGDAPPNDAMRLLHEVSRSLELGHLDRNDTHALLASVFGDVPNLRALVGRLHALGEGNPKALMHLAQHLLTRAVVRYDAGVWVLPERFDAADLPADMAQALLAAVQELPADARSLAACMALYPDQYFSMDEVLVLLNSSDRAAGHGVLEVLRGAAVIQRVGDRCALSNPAWAEALLIGVNDDERKGLHAALGRMFCVRDDGVRAARSLFLADLLAEGVDVLIDHSKRSSARTNVDQVAFVRLLMGVPRDWAEVYERAIALGRSLGRSARDVYAMHYRMVSLGSATSESLGAQIVELAETLGRAIGLDIYAELAASESELSDGARLSEALKRASVRQAQAPEAEQLMPLKEALGRLAQVFILAYGNMGNTLDLANWARMPSLEALAPLSPVLGMIAEMSRGFDSRMHGRLDEARELYIGVLAKLDAVGQDMEPTYAQALRSGVSVILGVLEAAMGLPSCDERISAVEAGALHEANGLMIRAIQALFRGDASEADDFERKREVRRLERPHPPAFQGLILIWNMQAHAACRDLTRAKQDLEAIERTAAHVPTWQPVLDWARGEFELVRGDAEAALAHLDRALTAMPAAKHMLWPVAVAARLRALLELGRDGELQRDAHVALAMADACDYGYQSSFLRMPLALSLARTGDEQGAWDLVQQMLGALSKAGVRGLSLGMAHETAVRVAMTLKDRGAFDDYMARLVGQVRSDGGRLFSMTHARLQREGARIWVAAQETPTSDVGGVGLTDQLSRLQSLLEADDNPNGRLHAGLAFLAAQMGATTAALFRWDELGVAMCARVGNTPVSEEVIDKVTEHLDMACGDNATRTCDLTGFGDPTTGQVIVHDGERYQLVVLSHMVEEGMAVSGAVLVRMGDAVTLDAAFELSSALSRMFTSFGDLTTQIAFG